MFSLPSLQSEVKELADLDVIFLDIVGECRKMSTDIVEYSKDVKTDLGNFKQHIMGIGEVDKQLSALQSAITELDSNIPEDSEQTYQQLCTKIDDTFKNHSENQETFDQVRALIDSIDNYIEQSEQTDENEDCDDIVVVASTASYKDPLTKQMIRNPVKSQVCGHSYEKSTILNYLQKVQKCPHSGCVSPLTRDDLVEDLEMKTKLRNMSQNRSLEGNTLVSEVNIR